MTWGCSVREPQNVWLRIHDTTPVGLGTTSLSKHFPEPEAKQAHYFDTTPVGLGAISLSKHFPEPVAKQAHYFVSNNLVSVNQKPMNFEDLWWL